MTTSATTTRRTASRPAVLGLAATSALLLAGCGVGTPVDTENQGGGGGEAETTLRLAHVYEPTHPVEECGITTLNEGSVHRFLLKPWDNVDLKGIIGMALRAHAG